ncbi:phospholipase D-like domain-containing protein [Rhodoferax sp. UBA5149]|uniref:phospholipase D-like domain-containing protein n=1 Tax=Rhodoferax sp. UBA5149 TaxID=1947379 RepID=UPI0025DC02B4|nr:phospholipase D-like domain-containing protein [Rhodoferax sp. UBA5149]
MLNRIFPFQWVTWHGLVVLLGLAIYAIASHTLRQRRHPSAAIAWVVSLVLLPYVALPLYLIFGSRKIVSARRALNPQPSTGRASDIGQPATQAGQLAAAMGLPQAASFERLTIHQDGGQALQSLRDMIDGAGQTLDLCSFLFGRDVLGDEIALHLIRRARDGVRIRLLIDGIGFYMGGHPNLKRLSRAGVQVALFVSPLSSPLRGRTNLRNHRKMVIVDGEWLWSGGRNLAAEYFEGDQTSLRKKSPWIDLSFDLRGALARQAQQRFEQDWVFATKGTTANTLQPALPAPAPTTTTTTTTTTPTTSARLVASGPDQAEDTIFTLLVSGCFTAHARILMVTPYFVPEPTLLMALTLAARRGVAVDLLLPRQSNHRLADMARHSALRELASAGASIWLAPRMIHAKAVLIDHDLALVGSANLDERSLFLNYELMVAFYDAPVVRSFARWIEQQRSSATRYRPRPPGLARDLVEGLVRWVAFQL